MKAWLPRVRRARFRRLAPRTLVASLASSAVAGGLVASLGSTFTAGCVPPGSSSPSDAGASITKETVTTTPSFRPSLNVMTAPFEDDFNRPNTTAVPNPAGSASASPGAPGSASATAAVDAAAPKLSRPLASPFDAGEAGAAPSASSSASSSTVGAQVDGGQPVGGSSLGPDWVQVGTSAWRIENGRLCGSNAHNHGVWLQRTLPVNARIEFDAISDDVDGDLKAEVWGDGRSAATGISYTNATSYLTIFGGWHNKFHAIARLNEHGNDRKEIKIDKESDDPVQKPVVAGQVYHFKIERTDGKTVRWSVDGLDYLTFPDPQPLAGMGHDHFGFNDWEAKVCFDNVRVTPL